MGNKLADKLSSKMDINDVVSFGPRNVGCNVVFIKDEKMRKHCSLFYRLNNIEEDYEDSSFLKVVSNAMINGFQSLTLKGPLCDEAMYGVGFVVDDIKITDDDIKIMDDDDHRSITTNIMTALRE